MFIDKHEYYLNINACYHFVTFCLQKISYSEIKIFHLEVKAHNSLCNIIDIEIQFIEKYPIIML